MDLIITGRAAPSVKYAYRPQLAGLIGSDVLAGLINMTQEAYAKPRLTTIIPLK